MTSAQPEGASRRLCFDHYLLDLDRGCLLFDGEEIALRPKTFAVLECLAANCGRLVSKTELFAAVWPNVAVTDDTLVQSITELRRAFGEEAGGRLIRTVPKRGYRLDADVTAAGTVAARAPQGWMRVNMPGMRLSASRVAVALFLLILGAAAFAWYGAGRSFDRSRETEAPFAKSGASWQEGEPAIAVLPFGQGGSTNMHASLADGLTQDLIGALGRFPELTVMSWNAVYPYKDMLADLPTVNRQLSVAYIVEGTVREKDDGIQVASQLIDTHSGEVLWSGTFEQPPSDLFTVEDALVEDVTSALSIRVAQAEQRKERLKPTDSLEAYDYVLRARPALFNPTRASNVEARALLKQAIDLDPGYAAAYAGLADTYYTSASMGWAESPLEYLGKAEELATKALTIDTSEVRARVVLARIAIFHQQFREAEDQIDLAIRSNPNDAQSLAGRGNILLWLGRTDEAISALEKARRIDPGLRAMDRFGLSLAYYLKKRYDAAVEEAELGLRETAGAGFARIVLAAALAEDNRVDDAARTVADIRRLSPTFDPQTFGTKFLNPADLQLLRDGLRKAGLLR